MKSRLIGLALLVNIALVSGCSTLAGQTALNGTGPMALNGSVPLPEAGCNQVTGSRVRASREATDCGPVGYPFRQYSLEDIRSVGEMDMNRLFQPRR
jgi:hypothetical protein